MLLYDYTWYTPNGQLTKDCMYRVRWLGAQQAKGRYTRVICINGEPEVTWYDSRGREIRETDLPWIVAAQMTGCGKDGQDNSPPSDSKLQ